MNPQRTKERRAAMDNQEKRRAGAVPSPFAPVVKNRVKKICTICFTNMLVALGQSAKYHKACRIKRPKSHKNPLK